MFLKQCIKATVANLLLENWLSQKESFDFESSNPGFLHVTKYSSMEQFGRVYG